MQPVVKQAHHLRGRTAGINDGFDDLLRAGKCPTDKHSRPRGLQRREFIRGAEAVLIQFDVEDLGKLRSRLGRLQADRQHHHLEAFLVQLAVSLCVM